MHNFAWWQRGTIYQIYPRSFQDSDGDGVGDLRGITARLDYLAWLGVDAIWISPFYPSPMVDFGYDITDYTGVHPLFGTLDDFDALVAAAHAQGLRVILDFVPNHSSDQHPWFLESRASRRNPRRDWYIWRDPQPDGSPPNNWLSSFGGPAWTFDVLTGQYYYHAFLKEQPDLNWRNPEVRASMADALRFWLERGVDGFRVDALRHLWKDEQLRDNPPNPDFRPGDDPFYSLLPRYSTDRPEIHGLIEELRAVIDAYDDRVMIGELYLPLERLVRYYGQGGRGVHLPFNFQLIQLPWDARRIAAMIAHYEALLPADGWPNYVLGNHDRSRIATRAGADQARVAAMLLLTLRGTPTLYYGDEIGMGDVPIPPELVQDPWEINVPGQGLGRDPERTPMQWDGRPSAGFTAGRPWLPVAGDHQQTNVAAQLGDPGSLLGLYRRLLALRRCHAALAVGSYWPLECHGHVLAYVREHRHRRLLIALNFGPEPAQLDMPPDTYGTVLLGTSAGRAGDQVAIQLHLAAHEGLIVALDT